MSDQGDLAKRWNAQSDDTNAFNPADDATGPIPAVDPVDEYGPAPVWSDSTEAELADTGQGQTDQGQTDEAESGQAEAWPTGPQQATFTSAGFEPEDEPPPGRLVFPEAQVPAAEDEPFAEGAAPALPERMPRPPRASDYFGTDELGMDYPATGHTGTGYDAKPYGGTDAPATDYTDTGRSGSDDAGAQYAGTDRTASEYTSSDYTGSDYLGSDYAGSDYPASDYQATDRTERTASDYGPSGYGPGYGPSEYGPSEYGPADYAAPESGPEFGAPGTPDDDREEADRAAARMEFSAPPAGGWEGSLFDGTADSEPGDGRYAPVSLSGPSTPPKPGTPSSGNLRIPDWMREENGGGAGGPSDEDDFGTKPRSRAKDKTRHKNRGADKAEDSGAGSRVALFAGVGLLVVALIASAVVYVLKSGGDSGAEPAERTTSPGRPAAGDQKQNPLPTPADKALRPFPGTRSNVIGRFTDTRAGLSYPRFGPPWQLPTKQNKLGQLGWSGQQIVVTEQRGTRLWYGQLLSGTLNPAELSMYGGTGTEKAAAVAFAHSIETRFYGFPHKTQPYASQALTVDGRKGWLISSYLRYQRPGVKATGELLVTAVIDTGGKAPAVLFIGIPSTHRKLWADVSYFLSNLHLAR
ncbi:hypothetical protein [Actinomadura sp. HBU206391]|uniref:hypothetical protein n=1 Tax=Actinomadura sp. HBU206391 TaxID=2731692 RepID=UPI00164FEDDE|nr:hypothetical protein [Actinomadura sp. HBU206391]MBC6456822.1 hypothetical protein [Actinomadura sp. HBU206391]